MNKLITIILLLITTTVVADDSFKQGNWISTHNVNNTSMGIQTQNGVLLIQMNSSGAATAAFSNNINVMFSKIDWECQTLNTYGSMTLRGTALFTGDDNMVHTIIKGDTINLQFTRLDGSQFIESVSLAGTTANYKWMTTKALRN